MLGEPVTQNLALARQDKHLHELSYNRRSFLRKAEIISYHQLEEFGKCQKERGDSSPYVLPISQSHYHWKPSWLRDAWATSKDPESEWLSRDNLETNPITIKRETVSLVAEQFSWVPLRCCSPPRQPFPIKSLALSAPVFPQTVRFQVLHNSPLSGPGKGLPSCNIYAHLRLCVCVSCSVASDISWPHRLYLASLLCPWNSPGKNTGVAIPFSRGSSWPRGWTQVSHIVGRFLTIWAAREAPIYVSYIINQHKLNFSVIMPN